MAGGVAGAGAVLLVLLSLTVHIGHQINQFQQNGEHAIDGDV